MTINTHVEPTRTLVVHPVIKFRAVQKIDATSFLEEAVELAKSLEVNVELSLIVQLSAVKAATYFSTGKLQEIKVLLAEHDIELLIVNNTLSPTQQRNLERTLHIKVIDRTALILEIFSLRARTKEGKFQVELAMLEYQKSRLVRSWTHLERQRGGLGKTGGPGETQIELDRRMIADKIKLLKERLKKVVKTRLLHRESRRKVPYAIVALVGYTNAGKSTLFNTLTRACVVAEDKLFATLDPTMRLVKLPSGRKVIISDTVGFISDLPTTLIAAFRATLEEVVEADLLLHIHDLANPAMKQQAKDVLEVLESLDCHQKADEQCIDVFNKVDLLTNEQSMDCGESNTTQQFISALSGKGCDTLLEAIDHYFAQQTKTITVNISLIEGELLAWIYRHAEIVTRNDKEDRTTLVIRVSGSVQAQLNKRLKSSA